MKRINLGMGEMNNPQRREASKRIVGKVIPVLIIAAILICLGVFITAFSSGSSVFNYIFSGSSLKSSDNMVNVLLLGTAGGTHDGPNLTDTIMVASYNLKTNQVYLISIPRDLWLPSFKSKVNAVYETGLAQNNGLGLTKTVIGNILGVPIQYALRIDFNGFVKAIDQLGGIDVSVANSFDDYNYPITGKEDDLCGNTIKEMDFSPDQAKQYNVDPGKQTVLVLPDGTIATDSAQEDMGAKYFTCRYEHISFQKGITHMDGITALKFVRSRHGTNGEASDFARSKRQQEVLEAVRQKTLSPKTLFDPSKISQLVQTLGSSVDTDISAKDAVAFYNLFKKITQIHTLTIDNSPRNGLSGGRTSLLINPNPADFGGAYVLISQDDDFSTIQNYVRNMLSQGAQLNGEATPSARSGSY